MNRERTFIILLLASLSIEAFFIGSSVTGNVVQTIYCENGVCNDFCIYDIDCPIEGQVCCEKQDFGICVDAGSCERPFTYTPDMALQYDPSLAENPSPLSNANLVVILAMTGVIVLLGLIFVLCKMKSDRKPVAAQRPKTGKAKRKKANK